MRSDSKVTKLLHGTEALAPHPVQPPPLGGEGEEGGGAEGEPPHWLHVVADGLHEGGWPRALPYPPPPLSPPGRKDRKNQSLPTSAFVNATWGPGVWLGPWTQASEEACHYTS